MNIKVELAHKVFCAGYNTPCEIRVQNLSNEDLSIILLTLFEGDKELDSISIDSLRANSVAAREMKFALEDRNPLEIEYRSLRMTILFETSDKRSDEQTMILNNVLVLPHEPPYIAGGVPVNSSFQGREQLYAELAAKFFQDNTMALFLNAPGAFGKTTFLGNLNRQAQFERAQLVILRGGSQKAVNAQSSQDPTEFENRIAQLVFRAPLSEDNELNTLSGFLRNQNAQLERNERYLVIAIDEMEDFLQSADKNETSRIYLHKIRDIYKNRRQGEFDRIRWLFCGDWSMDAKLRSVMLEHLSQGQIPSAGQLRTLDEQSGRRIVTVPTKYFLQYDEDALARIGWLTGWHPFLVQILCRQIYQIMNDRVKDPPGQVSSSIVEEAAATSLVQSKVELVWQRTLLTLKGLRLMTDILGAIKSLHANEATGIEILNAIMQVTPQRTAPLSMAEAKEIGDIIGLGSHNTNLATLVPGAIDYLCQLGLLVATPDNPPRYRLAAGLFVRYIDELPIAPSSRRRTGES